MNKEQEQVWDRLKHGISNVIASTFQFHGNGVSTKFDCAWFPSHNHSIRVIVYGVPQSMYRDFSINNCVLTFYKPPADGANIHAEVYAK